MSGCEEEEAGGNECGESARGTRTQRLPVHAASLLLCLHIFLGTIVRTPAPCSGGGGRGRGRGWSRARPRKAREARWCRKRRRGRGGGGEGRAVVGTCTGREGGRDSQGVGRRK